MKKVLLLALCCVFAANVAMADHLGVYADPAGTSCTLTPPLFALTSVYVVHKFTAGATASRFKVTGNAGGGTFVGASTPYAQLGNVSTGISIGYGVCLSGAINALQMNYFFGAAPTCGLLRVENDNIRPYVEVTDCGFADKAATGGDFYFGANGTCQNCNEVATEATTWGTIKALYR